MISEFEMNRVHSLEFYLSSMILEAFLARYIVLIGFSEELLWRVLKKRNSRGINGTS